MTPRTAPAIAAKRFRFRLYIAGTAPNSTRALDALHALCKQRLGTDYEVTVVDVFREPSQALADGVLVTPTLRKLAPGPVQTIVGDLSKVDLMQVLGLSGLLEPT
jgi:circadian clock protein KaiB